MEGASRGTLPFRTHLPRHIWQSHLAEQVRLQTEQPPSKEKQYATVTQTHDFVAVALESSGAWSSEGLDFVLELRRRLTDTTLDILETSYFFQRLSVAVQRGNAICFTSTLP